MGIFQYNNPLIKYMIKVANMMIVSLWWLICCIPVITIIPSCTAMYETMVDVINGTGDGVTRYFFTNFKEEFRKGWIYSLFILIAAFFLYTAIDFGLQLWKESLFATGYLAMGLIICLIIVPVLIFIPPVLSHFSGKIGLIIRLSFYFTWKKPLRTLLAVILFLICAFAIGYYPILALLAPGLYADLIHNGMEKTIGAYLAENAPEKEEEETDEIVEEDDISDLSSLDFDRKFKE